MQDENAIKFAQWLARDQPELFIALYRRANVVSKAANGLKDFTDLLSSIGSGIATAASSVGTYLTSSQGLQTLTALSSAYLTSKAANQAVGINLQRAQQGLPPAPIQTTYNPTTMQYEAVLPNGQRLPSGVNTAFSSGFSFASIPVWAYVAAGGLVLGLLFFSSRSRR
jgi:hypothetical protein